jgi:hypothetical protein
VDGLDADVSIYDTCAEGRVRRPNPKATGIQPPDNHRQDKLNDLLKLLECLNVRCRGVGFNIDLVPRF